MKKRFFIIGIIILIIDQITKVVMINKNISIIPNFLNFTYTKNFGGAFGIGSKYIVLIISILIIIGIIIYIVKYKEKIKNYLPYTLIIWGSIGNLIDRIVRGYVIDFIDVNLFNFPNFNISDISIVLGVILIVYKIIKDIIFRKD